MRIIAIPAAIPSTRLTMALARPIGVAEMQPSPMSSPAPPLHWEVGPNPFPPLSASAVCSGVRQRTTLERVIRIFFSRNFFIGTLDITYYPCFGQGGLEDR